jgi:hypothetical protein
MLTMILVDVVATTSTAVDAERGFSLTAQRDGQSAAFHIYADPDAVIFTPQAIWARDFIKEKENLKAGSSWSTNVSYVSCDGQLAVNTGPWRSSSDGRTGFFTTVWEWDKGRWHWISHGRHTAVKPIAARTRPIVRKGSCKGRAPGPPLMTPPSTKTGPGGAQPDDFGRGYSADRTLGWEWRVGPNGGRQFRAFLWTGKDYVIALNQKIGG